MADIDPDVVKAVLEAQGNKYEKMKADAAAILQNSKDLTEELTKQLGVQQKYATEQEKALEVAQQIQSIAEKEIAALEKKDRDLGEAEQKRLAALKEKARLARKEIDSLKAITELQASAEAITQNMLENTLGLKDTQEDYADLLIDSVASGAKLGDVLKGAAKAFSMAARPTVLLKGLKNRLKDLVPSYKDNVIGAASLNTRMQELDITLTRVTGATKEMGAELKDVRSELLANTYVMEEVEAAFTTLTLGSDVFNTVGAKTRENLTETAAMLARFGVSADTTAESIDNLVFGMNQTPDAAAVMTEEMSRFAREMGFKGGPNALLKEFNSQLPLLARYGKEQGVKIFKALAVTAKATGIEMGKLVEIAGQFDTFEGAAEAAGKLNMVLGGPMLNSIKLLNATEEERIQMLKDGVAASGKSFEQMGRFERDLLAQTLGVSTDVAAALFTRDLGNIKEATAALQAETDAAENLSEEAENRRTLGEKAVEQEQLQLEATKELNTTLYDLQQTLADLKKEYAGFLGVLSVVADFAAPLFSLVAVLISLGIKMKAIGAIFLKVGAVFLKGGAIIASVFQGILIGAAALAGFILTPFGLITAAVAGLAFFFRDELGGAFDWVMDKLKSLADFFSEVFSDIKSGIGSAIDAITPDFFANGVTGYQGGAAIVGERGPEMVTLPAGSNVITNENVRKMAGGSNATAASGAGKQQTINVVLKLDSDVLAKHSAKVARDVVKTTLEFG